MTFKIGFWIWMWVQSHVNYPADSMFISLINIYKLSESIYLNHHVVFITNHMLKSFSLVFSQVLIARALPSLIKLNMSPIWVSVR